MQFFPYLTETFIYREVLALREHGLNIRTVANRYPAGQDLPPDVAHLKDSTVYIFPLTLTTLVQMIFAHCFWLFTRPRRYLEALRMLVTEDSRRPRIWLRNGMHFAGGTYLAWRLRKQGIGHAHAHFSTNAASLACFAAHFLDIPFSMTVHNELFIERLLLPAKLQRASFIACISDYSRRAVLRDYPDLPLEHKLKIIHCGITPPAFALEQRTSHAVPLILSASQLVERKGILYLVEACAILKGRGLSFRCRIAGDGSQRPVLEAAIQRLGLTQEVELTGRYVQSQMRELFAEADVFVLPCITTGSGEVDGIPVALMEAMAAGISVISTPVSGIPELIESGVNGLLVAEKDALTLADAMQRLLTDPALREALIPAAKARISNEFNSQRAARELAALFAESLSP